MLQAEAGRKAPLPPKQARERLRSVKEDEEMDDQSPLTVRLDLQISDLALLVKGIAAAAAARKTNEGESLLRHEPNPWKLSMGIV